MTDSDKVLNQWDDFIDGRALPYFADSHKVMMRQVLDRFPFGKLSDVSDDDLLDCVNLKSNQYEPSNSEQKQIRKFRFFLGHFDAFLSRYDMERID